MMMITAARGLQLEGIQGGIAKPII